MTGAVPESASGLTFAGRAERYGQAVLAGDIEACKWVKAAAQRHFGDLERSAADPAWPWVFDLEKAGRPCHFIELLPHIKGQWAKPTVHDGYLHVPRIELDDAQVFFVAVLFGWVHRQTGLRRFRRAYLEEARKNAKSTLAAGLGLYLAFGDQEPGAEVYAAATKRDQAKIVWDVARQMVLRERDFSSLGVGISARAIYQERTGSKFEPLGRDSDSIDGLNSHAFIADELHAWRDRKLYDVLDSSTGARSQPLGIGITTAGYNQTGVCFEHRQYLMRILNGTLRRHGGMGYRVEGDTIEDDAFFGLIYTLDEGYADGRPDDAWMDESKWIKANPLLGTAVSIDDMRASCVKAMNSPQSQAEFRTKRVNQWLAADSVWMDLTKWDACADHDLTEEQFAGEECYIALDAAFKTDFFAKVKLFRRDEDYYFFGRYWIPESQIHPTETPKLYEWAKAGLIQVAPGSVTEIEPIREALRADRKLHQVLEVPYDPAMLTQFATELLEEGFPMVEIRPTFNRFSEPMKKLEEIVLQKRAHHNGDPVLRWMISNVVCRHKAGLIYPTKPIGEERARKIDGVIALLMALGRAIANGGANAMPDNYEMTAA